MSRPEIILKRVDSVDTADERLSLVLGNEHKFALCFQKDTDSRYLWNGEQWYQLANPEFMPIANSWCIERRLYGKK